MRLRFDLVAVAALAAVAMLRPASAEQGSVQPASFQIFGGMNTGQDGGAGDIIGGQSISPADLRHRTVDFATSLPAGSIDIRTAERNLYYVLGDGKAVLYRVGVGREGFSWSGTNHVSRMAEWPEWRPPAEMIAREKARGHQLPDFMAGGVNNPLGARAIYIGDTQYRIHGTTQPWSIGLAMSSGCIRMMNEEVIDLYNRVQVGALVVVE